MRSTVTFDGSLLHELMIITHARTKAQAVLTAVKEYIKGRKLAGIKSLRGRLKFDMSAEEIRHRER